MVSKKSMALKSLKKSALIHDKFFMSLITLKDVTHENKTSQNGKSYVSCKLIVWNTKENKDVFISGFGDGVTKTWNPGDKVDVDLSQSQDGKYWNFKTNANSKPSESPIVKLLKEISAKLDYLNPNKAAKVEPTMQDLADTFGGVVVDNPLMAMGQKELTPEDINF